MDYLHHYKASAFEQNNRFFGEIALDKNTLYFKSGNTRVNFPLKNLMIRAGGANDKMIFLTHANYPGWTVCTTDHELLKDSYLNSHTQIAEQTAKIQQGKTRTFMILAFILVLCAASLYALFALKEPLVTALAKRIPPSWEQKLGDAAFLQIKAEKGFVENDQAGQALKKIIEPLFSKIPQERYGFKVHIARDPAVNAFALPGGIIVLNTGMITSAATPEEIAGVLAHEAAHVTLQHGTRQLIASVGIFALIQAFFGDVTGLAAILVDNSALLLTRKYSRDYEQEADDIGWSYLENANINPQGMIDFFKLLLKKQNENKAEKAISKIGDSLNFLSTHPTTTHRIEYLQNLLEKTDKNREYMQFDLDFKEFQDLTG
ncbi:M48 family metallopeptidase [Desulfobacterales bacterium HSG17]|nr:M48 family metallopeptidase [Desulfobacterales bacterium HSG17]